MKRRHILTTFPALLAACLPAFAQEAQKLQEAKNEQSPQKENAAMKHPATVPQKATIFITGSTDGLGHAAAKMLLEQGHRVIVHARSGERFDALEDLSAMGAIKTVGDLAEIVDVQNLARQVNTIGTMDAIIHNAGVYRGDKVMLVNTVAPYLLTAWIRRPKRLIYISSGMHRSGNPENLKFPAGSYSDSKLFITTIMAATARLWPEVACHAVDPGWVPTKMGGANAPDDLRLGHLTQEWLATSNDAQVLQSGGYWHHQQRQEPHQAVGSVEFQNKLIDALTAYTNVDLRDPKAGVNLLGR